ncbi:helix-turn-helix domain-containing protein [Luteitalea sp. TBR-22]|uniref:helix-turn-helix domain-containing protein n=1 Tax=Luteitalea sp. TBR-22 TaxID=2802971 RepID=UPI001EF41E9A|nr:helix-turn-helix transcriptional regulator [Luteitalea sp. TBR-22]
MVSPVAPNVEPVPFRALLRTWRQRRRLSQLALALETGVSQRHLSFLESGRAAPSRAMVLQLGEALDVPLRVRNEWLVAAGFAPIYRARTLDDPQMRQVHTAVRLMLANHEPFPAVAIDRTWTIRLSNASFDRLVDLVGPGLWERVGGPSRNLMRLFFHREGLRPFVANWREIAPLLWQRAQREAAAADGADMQAVLAELAPHVDAETRTASEDSSLLPVLPLVLERDGVRLSLFTVIATFGTPQDVTTDELRVESLFPADEPTAGALRSLASTAHTDAWRS